MVQSWRLKINRAEKHLEEVKREMRAYAKGHPYKAVRGRPPKGQKHIWLYRLRITEQPDPMIAVIIGDFLHNLRSALDHLSVAIAPASRKWKASFPIEMRDIWATGTYVVADNERRRSFTSAVKGMPDEAVAIIKEVQPYNMGAQMEIQSLGVLSRLENADKHRSLITFGVGVKGIQTTIKVRGETHSQNAWGFREDGAEVAKFGFDAAARVTESEVDVQVSGTATIAIKIAGVDEYLGMPESLEILRNHLGGEVLPALQPFVRSMTDA